MEQTATQTECKSPIPITAIRYCLYARKSSESDEKQALSIDSQVKEMLQIAEKEGIEIIDIRRESHSAKNSGERPVFNEIISDIRRGRFNAILTWAPDRLSRNAGDLGTLVDLMDQKVLLEIKTYGQKFTNSPNEKFLLMILGSQAKLENDNKSVNVKRGLKMRVEMGLWPGAAPTGYLNEKRVDRKGHVLIDPERASVIKKMFERVAYEKWSGRKLYHWLKFELNFRTKNDHHLSLSNIYLILQNSFYCGVFEYPQGSGNWYTGKHQPIISRDLFDRAQEQIKKDQIQRQNKEFAFTRLITCGLCGSGITAEEKFKKQKNGNVHRYVYYGCTRSRDLHCKGGYIREEELISQLTKLLDKVEVNKLGIQAKFEKEMERYSSFRKFVLGLEKNEELPDEKINIKTYAKYLLNEGTVVEKRELLGYLKSKLIIKDKVVQLEK